MRAAIAILLFITGCGAAPFRREPGLAGFLHILHSARDAREACAGLGRECGTANLESALMRAEAEAPAALFLDPGQAAEERPLVDAALQAATADCRGRGIRPDSPRWDRCRLDRGIARLSDAVGLTGGEMPGEDLTKTRWGRRAATP